MIPVLASISALACVAADTSSPTFDYTTIPALDPADREVFVSWTDGDNDLNDGLSSAAPKKDWWSGSNHAGTLMRTGYGDRMLLKRGDTWNVPVDRATNRIQLHGGFSADRPMMLYSYGTSVSRPKVYDTYIHVSNGGSDGSHVWVYGVHLERTTEDPDIPNHGIEILPIDLAGDVLVEDCKIVAFGVNINIAGNNPDDRPNDIRIRKNVIVDAWSNFAHAQGVLMGKTMNWLFEGNVFDRNGWLASPPDPVGVSGLSMAAATSTVTRSSGSFVTDGWVVGADVVLQGFTIDGTPNNLAVCAITDVQATTLTFDPGVHTFIDESAASAHRADPPARQTIYSHNMYLSPNNDPTGTIRGNLSARASLIGCNSGGVASLLEYNILLANSYGTALSGFAATIFRKNCIIEGKDCVSSQDAGVGATINTAADESTGYTTEISDNIIANNNGHASWAMNVGGAIHDLDIHHNVVYNWLLAFRGSDSPSNTFVRTKFRSNEIVWPGSQDGAAFWYEDKPVSAGIALSDNTWSQASGLSGWTVNGSVVADSAAWIAASGETGGVYTEPTYPAAASATAAGLAAFLGIGSDIDAVMTEARLMSREDPTRGVDIVAALNFFRVNCFGKAAV